MEATIKATIKAGKQVSIVRNTLKELEHGRQDYQKCINRL